MFNNDYTINNDRPRGALEVAIRARKKERILALLVADYQGKKSARPEKKGNSLKGLLAALFMLR